jgi:hypothetical protein
MSLRTSSSLGLVIGALYLLPGLASAQVGIAETKLSIDPPTVDVDVTNTNDGGRCQNAAGMPGGQKEFNLYPEVGESWSTTWSTPCHTITVHHGFFVTVTEVKTIDSVTQVTAMAVRVTVDFEYNDSPGARHQVLEDTHLNNSANGEAFVFDMSDFTSGQPGVVFHGARYSYTAEQTD